METDRWLRLRNIFSDKPSGDSDMVKTYLQYFVNMNCKEALKDTQTGLFYQESSSSLIWFVQLGYLPQLSTEEFDDKS